jgi:hypothetical protein
MASAAAPSDAAPVVPPTSPSQDLPTLYRVVLDGVSALEGRGERATAAAIRREAIAAYSAAWDDRHRAVLTSLVGRVRRELDRAADRVSATPDRTQRRRFERRSR